MLFTGRGRALGTAVGHGGDSNRKYIIAELLETGRGDVRMDKRVALDTLGILGTAHWLVDKDMFVCMLRRFGEAYCNKGML